MPSKKDSRAFKDFIYQSCSHDASQYQMLFLHHEIVGDLHHFYNLESTTFDRLVTTFTKSEELKQQKFTVHISVLLLPLQPNFKTTVLTAPNCKCNLPFYMT